ncbi:MAG: ABC transporter permease, partial [Cyanobacteria bacterium NC_groundwater_1444_Ag_S-0.65um_54_12]|nr:ABC transporter permease [Cyanobacteria bacterium NC_groundwater_1444_Ag_S-0.65um_54_12]
MTTMMLWHRTAAVARKELTQIRRDHALMRLIIIMPLMMLIIFGYAINNSVKDIALAVWDESRDRISQALLQSFENERRFRVIHVATRTAMLEAVRAGQARAALHIPAGALVKARSE